MEESLKATRKHFSKLGGMFILGTIIIYAVQLIPAALVQVFKPEWLMDANISLMISMLPMYLIGMPILIVLVKTVPAEKVEKKKMKAGHFVLAALMCFGLAYASNFIGTILTTVIGMLKGGMVQNAIMNIATSINVLLAVLFMVICAPLIEEYVFRKLVVDRTIKYGQGVAVLLSGLMFGLFHGNLNQFIYAFAIGCFLAFLYVKTGNLKITIIIHMIFNFLGGVVSVRLLEMIDMERYMEIVQSGMDMDALMIYMSENAVGWICYMMFALFIFATIITALVLFIVSIVKNKFVFEQGQVAIPKGKRFRTVILNVGMLIYCIFWTAVIIIQLFA
jgi:membrane protease YdiL (CAAX protease family)